MEIPVTTNILRPRLLAINKQRKCPLCSEVLEYHNSEYVNLDRKGYKFICGACFFKGIDKE